MMIPVWVHHACANIRYWFNPRQKWLIKKIPNRWVDKDQLWEICIFEGIRHHVEQDGGQDSFNNHDDPEYPEHQKVFDRELKKAYENVVHYIPALEYALKVAWEKVPKANFNDPSKDRDNRSYEQIYGNIDALEKEIDDKKTEVMLWAVKNRGSIWT